MSFLTLIILIPFFLAGCGTGVRGTASTGVSPLAKDSLRTISRLTPEQASNQFFQATGVRLGETYEGEFVDYFLYDYAVPLGGVDFDLVSVRDPLTKVQTLLASRTVAWEFALTAIAQPTLFTQADVDTDRPVLPEESGAENISGLQSSEGRWRAQLDTFYWNIFSRSPTDSEATAIKSAFITAYRTENNTSTAWTAVLYALFSTIEFWNL